MHVLEAAVASLPSSKTQILHGQANVLRLHLVPQTTRSARLPLFCTYSHTNTAAFDAMPQFTMVHIFLFIPMYRPIIAASELPTWVLAASGLASSLHEEPSAAALGALAALASERLGVLAQVDPHTATELQGHLDTAMAALGQVGGCRIRQHVGVIKERHKDHSNSRHSAM